MACSEMSPGNSRWLVALADELSKIMVLYEFLRSLQVICLLLGIR